MKQSALLGSKEVVSLGCQPWRFESTPFCRRPSVLGYSLPEWNCQIRSLFQTTVPADAVPQVPQHGRYRLVVFAWTMLLMKRMQVGAKLCITCARL